MNKYIVTPQGISIPSMTNTNAMGNSEVCKILNDLEAENQRLTDEMTKLREWLKGNAGDTRYHDEMFPGKELVKFAECYEYILDYMDWRD